MEKDHGCPLVWGCACNTIVKYVICCDMLMMLSSPSFPNQGCLCGSYNKERIWVRVRRDGVSPVMQERFPQRSWYQDLGTRHVVPRSWYQHLGTKILVPRSWNQTKTESLRGGASQKLSKGARGAAGPPARGSGRLEAFQVQQRVWWAAAPQEKQFIARFFHCRAMLFLCQYFAGRVVPIFSVPR